MQATNLPLTQSAASPEQCSSERRLVEEYFRSFNENQFQQTAALFAEEGKLVPPFDSPVVGKQSILAYLEKEAGDITALPKYWETEVLEDKSLEDNRTQINVTGKVNAIVFKVNVAWYFTIGANSKTDAPKIERVRVKLLASPKELLGLRSKSSSKAS